MQMLGECGAIQHFSSISEVMRQLADLKNINKDLKVLVSVGGVSFTFTKMVSTQATRKKFIDYSISYLRSQGTLHYLIFLIYYGERL